MSQPIRLALLGAGATARAHAAGAEEAGGFRLVAAADLIPQRLEALAGQFKIPTTVSEADKLLLDPQIDAVCVCLPTFLHAPIATAALKAGKHVLLDVPPASTVRDASAIAKAAQKSGKVLLYSAVRRFGAAEQSARQAIDKGYAGTIYHARATWLRTRGVPQGTGWYTTPEQSGGGAMIDLGSHLIDLLLHLLSPDKVVSVFAVAHKRLNDLKVEEAASAVLRFESGASAELAVAWAINQPPSQAGTTFRLSGESGAIDLYTPQGPVLHRSFDDAGRCKSTPLKQPRVAGHSALMRHFKECVQGEAVPLVDGERGVLLMQIVEAIYRSVQSGKAVSLKG